MSQAATLTIQLTGAGAAPGSPPVTTGGLPTPLPGGAGPYGLPPGAWAQTWQPGMPPPPVQGGAGPANPAGAAGGFTAAVNAAAKALQLFAGVVNRGTDYFLTIRGTEADEIAGRKTRIAADAERSKATTDLVGGLLALAGFATGNPLLVGAGAATAAVGRASVAGDEAFENTRKAFQERSEQLGRYSGPLGGALGRQRAARIQQEAAEANALGPQLARLTDQQTQLDIVQRQLQFAQRAQAAQEQQARVGQQLDRMRKELAGVLNGLRGDVRKAVEKFLDGGENPIRKLLRGLDLPTDRRPEIDEALKKDREAKAGAPILGGP
jgi:hypothetical protein